MRVSISRLQEVCVQALVRTGMSHPDAVQAADVLVTTDSWGVFTHGTKNLLGYIHRLRAGGLNPKAVPKVVKEGPAWAHVNADGALGMIGSCFAMRQAISKARQAGVGYVALTDSCHFGAAGYYAALAAAEGFLGMAMANDTPTVTVPGGRGPVLGSNPLAISIPAGEEQPVLLDMATSSVAGGKVFAAAARGESIPANWIVDAQGLPTTDPSRFPHEGALTPMAGHKGYGIALWIEVLSAVIPGAAVASQVLSWSFADPGLRTGHGAAFLVLDPSMIHPQEDFRVRMDRLIREIRNAPRASGADRIYIPGEMEWERRSVALQDGIHFPEEFARHIRALCAEFQFEI